MIKCKCGGIAKAYSEQRGTLFGNAIAYIKCTSCGKRTNTYSAFWTSDASEEARQEWRKMNICLSKD